MDTVTAELTKCTDETDPGTRFLELIDPVAITLPSIIASARCLFIISPEPILSLPTAFIWRARQDTDASANLPSVIALLIIVLVITESVAIANDLRASHLGSPSV